MERKKNAKKEGRIGKIKQSPHQYRREEEHTLLLSIVRFMCVKVACNPLQNPDRISHKFIQ